MNSWGDEDCLPGYMCLSDLTAIEFPVFLFGYACIIFKVFPRHHLLVPSVCEHLVSLIQGLSSTLLEVEVASDHLCAVLRIIFVGKEPQDQ